MSDFAEMTEAEQIALLEEFAQDVLMQYGMIGSEFECVNHTYNTTFKFKGGDNKKYALRIGTRERKWPEHTWAEVQWLLELKRVGSIFAPVPIANLQGEPFSNHYFFYQGGNLDVVIHPWLEGEELSSDPSDEQLFELGRAMATMHLLGKNWKPKGYANFLPIDKPLMVKQDNLFTYELEEISPTQYELFRKVNERTEKFYESLRQRTEPQLIHADLQFENIRWLHNKILTMDFDYAGIGFPLQDLAMSTYYLRKGRERERHLFQGYASVTPLPEFDPAELELLIASRELVLLNRFLGIATADDIVKLPNYLETIEQHLQYFLKTGEFTLENVGSEGFEPPTSSV